MDLVFRSVFVFVLILVITRAVGRRELSSMEPFDLILLVVIGDLVQQGVTQSDYSLTGATTVLEGEPTLLIADGEILARNLRRERMTVGEIRAEARLQSIGSLKDIRYA